jgi:hypothetical protein
MACRKKFSLTYRTRHNETPTSLALAAGVPFADLGSDALGPINRLALRGNF